MASRHGSPHPSSFQHTHQSLRQAAEALGWQGDLVPYVCLFGMTASIVVTFDRDAHAYRRRAGTDHPMMDADTLAMWEWPEGSRVFPPPALSIVGVLAHHGRTPRDLVATARKWRGFSASGVVLGQGQHLPEDLELECAFSGIGVVRQEADRVSVLRLGPTGRLSTARRTTVDRWVEEQLYGMLLGKLQLADALL
jgi:hypothetical protein